MDLREKETICSRIGGKIRGSVRFAEKLEDQMLKFKEQADMCGLMSIGVGLGTVYFGIITRQPEIIASGVGVGVIGFGIINIFQDSLNRYIKRYNIDL